MAGHLPPLLFPPDLARALHEVVEVDLDTTLTEFDSPAARARLATAEVLITCWGAPRLDADALAAAPLLHAVIHAAGTVKPLVSPPVFERGIVVGSAAAANALPVAEYTLAMILLAGKDAFGISRRYRAERQAIDLITEYPKIGNYGRTVGILGASLVGRAVLRLLAPFEDLRLLVHDPFLTAAGARALGAELVELDALFTRSDVLSIHVPALSETLGMVNSTLLALLPDGATVINTARGSVVDQEALVDELRNGRISAVLDVTEPEVIPAAAQLWELPNVVLTPHLAGSVGTELHRLGATAIDEVRRFVQDKPLRHRVDPIALGSMA
ncbi:MAG TPA: hydroxyacid dehydrogenase [Pseudonocardiaceae bacterium]|nr:hydroxyacid dehydrogenase [Pseudonocardiaceae bacterium]